MEKVASIKKALKKFEDVRKAELLQRFFRTFQGGYGEGDVFIGVIVPVQRAVSRKYYQEISLDEIEKLLNEPVHEYRLTALFMLILKYQKAKGEAEQSEIVNLYLRNLAGINNWDLVDSSAHKILGHYFFNRDKNILYEFAHSGNLWKQRIAVISTFYFISNNRYDDALNIAVILLKHKHDLIHKAVGWMLRETGKRNYKEEFDFLKKHYQTMPRTMLRYAIEKFQDDVRQQFLKGTL